MVRTSPNMAFRSRVTTLHSTDGLESVNDLPRLIRSQRDGIENEHRVAETYRTEITQVVQDINKVRPLRRLRCAHLSDARPRHPATC